ncbi:MAG: RidA family protein [Anaerolineaceae bacterium]|nr:RidA family protein [Anaerolineaceae bacterium]MCY3936508.1 RidA family protein [Chloroflexota bacterium]MCY4009242.1 RidA family protein [Anaerolineaceae bacterium]
MGNQVIYTKQAPEAAGPYSQAIVRDGWLFGAGQVGLDPASQQLVSGGIEEQTAQVFRNIRAVLEAAGAQLEDVVKTSVFLQDIGDFAAMNEVYAQHFGASPPARSTFAVAGLPLGALVEIEYIARLSE